MEESEDQVSVRKWLMCGKTPCDTGEQRQSLLRPWTWLQIEARKVIIEIANKVETDALMNSEEYGVLKLEEQKPTLKTNHKNTDDDAMVVMTHKEQKITSLWKKQRAKLCEEQSRLERIQIGERKRAALIEKIQPWRWREMEAGRGAGKSSDVGNTRKRNHSAGE